MIGQSSTEAERKRAARLENKALLPPRTKGGHLSDIRPPEIEIELGLMPGAIFGLPLHSICFQEIKYFVFLKATS